MGWFKKLKIRVKLLTAFIILVVLTVVVGVYGVLEINTLTDAADTVYSNCTKPMGDLAFITRDYYKLRLHFREMRLPLTQEGVRKEEAAFNEAYKSLQKNNEDYEANLLTEEGKKMFKVYLDSLNLWVNFCVNTGFQMKKDGRHDELMAIFPRWVELGRIIAEDKIEELVQLKDKVSVNLNETNRASAITARMVMIIIVIACAIISIILGFYIANMISRPIVVIEEKSTYIANTGDLRSGVEVDTKDEIFTMNEALKKMIGNFGTLVKKVMTEVEHITKESDELSSVSDVSASASVELQAQTHTAASSSEEVSANVATVASSVEELSASIKEISKNTASATVLTKQSEERANEASKVMNRLGQSSLEIGNIVKSITDIAEQTNLLALNATIEAARAGELGKGFAVVANEVKDLAKESAKATEDITKKIKAIQDDTKNAIDVIKEIIQNAVKINDVTTSIASAVEEQAVTTNEVNRNIGEATVGVGSIVEVITGIMQAVNDYANQANQVKNSSAVLKMLAAELDTQIKENFTV
jgi:methyl-accepting chemotaxis protein